MLKEKLSRRELSIGTWITLPCPSIAEILAKVGFDWIAVDMEHGSIGICEAQDLIRVISLAGIAPLVRLSWNDPVQIKRVMDAGAHGIIVPMIKSAEEARVAVDAVFYPPRGFRGVGLARAQEYGHGFDAYKEWLEHEAVVIVQIEHIDAVNNIETILTTSGVNGYILGPYDMSASLGKPGDLTCSEMVNAIEKVSSFAKENMISGGIHVIEPDPQETKKRIKEGFNFIAYSLDIRVLDATMRDGLNKING